MRIGPSNKVGPQKHTPKMFLNIFLLAGFFAKQLFSFSKADNRSKYKLKKKQTTTISPALICICFCELALLNYGCNLMWCLKTEQNPIIPSTDAVSVGSSEIMIWLRASSCLTCPDPPKAISLDEAYCWLPRWTIPKCIYMHIFGQCAHVFVYGWMFRYVPLG